MNRTTFGSQFTPLFNGKAKNGKVDVKGFHSLMGKIMECRQKMNHDSFEVSLEMATDIWAKAGFAGSVDVQSAVNFTWELVNDG